MNKKNILLIISLVLIIMIAGYFIYKANRMNGVNRESEVITVKAKTTGDKSIDNLIVNLKKSMEDYMKVANPSYSQKHIDECVNLLSEYTISIFKTHSKEEGMEVVKSTILKLNALNDKCDNTLIETNERESK